MQVFIEYLLEFYMADKKLKGIGGWLLFYTILLTFRLILAIVGFFVG